MYRTIHRLRLAPTVILILSAAAVAPADPQRWEPDIQAFEAADRRSPPQGGGVLFIGSSSIRQWDTDRWFPDLSVVNRGFGGSQLEDVLFHLDRIVLPQRPRLIALYEGDNDIASGKTPRQVFEDYKRFVGRVHAALPGTRIVFIAIKPSIARWELAPQMALANAMVRSHAARDARLGYADIFTPMLGEDGLPRPELFVEDGLHLNEDGYELWTAVVRPMIERADADFKGAESE